MKNGYNPVKEKSHLPLDDDDVRLLMDAEPLRSEPRGFAPDQMIRCEACLRANPPTRTSCLYCAAQLPTTEANAPLQRPTLRRLEKWEQGFNVILMPGGARHPTDEIQQEAAQLLRLGLDDLRRIIEAQKPLPVALASAPEEAALIERRLSEIGMKAFVVADYDLDSVVADVKRVRALELTERALVLTPSGGGASSSVPWAEIKLLVTGRIFVREIEVEERKGRGVENEILDAREMSADESMLDIYTAQDQGRLRIAADNFDFSCLGMEKKLIAAQNFSTLVETLRSLSTDAVYDDSYNGVRHALTAVWSLEQQTESRGWRRRRPGQVSTEAITRIDNESQFNRYSQLRRYLQLHHSEFNA
jgi:hypothetical protein